MKKLYGLINFEFRYIFKIVLAISLLLIIGQNILLYLTARDYLTSHRYLPFENLISLSGAPIGFYICFTLVLATCVYSVLSNYVGSKSIYTLMTLPQNRSFIYISKLLAGVASVLMLIAAQFISVFCGYGLFSTSIESYKGSIIYLEKPVNALFLAFIKSDLLRMIFPLSMENLISTVSIFISIIIGVYYVTYSIQARRYLHVGLVIINIILIIFVLSYRRNALNGVWNDHNLFVYSALFLVFAAFYVWQSIRWIRRSSTIS